MRRFIFAILIAAVFIFGPVVLSAAQKKKDPFAAASKAAGSSGNTFNPTNLTPVVEETPPPEVVKVGATPEADTKNQESAEDAPLHPGSSKLGKDANYLPGRTDIDKIQAEGDAAIDSEDAPKEEDGPEPKIEMVVDGSGSMGQNLGPDRTRMYYMKKMLTRYFKDQYQEKASIGMRVYGSRRKGDCSDNVLSVPFAERSLAKAEVQIEKLDPVGKTPLFKAVKDAANDLKSYNGPRAMVVFTDGEDTCGGNPCEDTKDFRNDPKLDIQIFIVAIGFKPNAENLKKISCMGDTQTANNEDDLFSAMGGIQSKMFVGKGNRLNLKVDSPDKTAEVQLFTEVNGEWTYLRSFTAAFGTKVPPGRYQALVMLSPVYKFATFTVPERKVVTLHVRGNGTAEVQFIKGQPILDVQILDKNLKVVEQFKSDQPHPVPTGRWKMNIKKAPFYERFVPKIDMVPNFHYTYRVSGAGALKVTSKDTVGLYVYSKKTLLGNFLTNFPFVLPIGEYRVHVNADCDWDQLPVKDDGHVMNLVCGPGTKPNVGLPIGMRPGDPELIARDKADAEADAAENAKVLRGESEKAVGGTDKTAAGGAASGGAASNGAKSKSGKKKKTRAKDK